MNRVACPRCGAENGAWQWACSSCGSSLGPRNEPTIPPASAAWAYRNQPDIPPGAQHLLADLTRDVRRAERLRRAVVLAGAAIGMVVIAVLYVPVGQGLTALLSAPLGAAIGGLVATFLGVRRMERYGVVAIWQSPDQPPLEPSVVDTLTAAGQARGSEREVLLNEAVNLWRASGYTSPWIAASVAHWRRYRVICLVATIGLAAWILAIGPEGIVIELRW